jgi:tRNA threonylcarbamoyladenosine biosynthesis protein TsaE
MITYSAEDTILLGSKLARKLSGGDVVALYGTLGSGKTVFTKGIGKGLGIKDYKHINSPTFVLVKEYEANVPLYHMDLYRLDSVLDVENLGIREYIYGNGVTVIEWPEKIKELLPAKHVAVRFLLKGGDKREIKIEDLRH